jgi:uridine kinase
MRPLIKTLSYMRSFQVASHTLNEISNELRLEHQRTAVAVCGLGGTGKSTICRQVAEAANSKYVVFELDWYLTHSSRDRQSAILQSLEGTRADIEFWKNPTNWYDWSVFQADLKQLKDTGHLKRSGLWRQSTGDKDLEVTIELPSSGVVLCDGIYLAHPAVRPLFDKVVLLEAPAEEALERSAIRDSHRNPAGYRDFKASVAATFDVSYFIMNRASVDAVIRL